MSFSHWISSPSNRQFFNYQIRKKDHDGVITLEEFLDNYETVLNSHISDNGQLFHDELWQTLAENCFKNSLDQINLKKKLFWANLDHLNKHLLQFFSWEFGNLLFLTCYPFLLGRINSAEWKFQANHLFFVQFRFRRRFRAKATVRAKLITNGAESI